MADKERKCDCSGGCGPAANRRDFLKMMGVSATALAAGMPVMAGPFNKADFEKLIPADKKLSPEWIASLYARGKPTVYHGDELAKIGMPIGGICTGQVYLGGDGKLWHWDIFNQHIPTGSDHYANPPAPDFPFEQGFAVRVRQGDKTTERALDHTGFADISFQGEYPIGYVQYHDPGLPVSVSLEAFSPFIPLHERDSHLPATILRYTVKNESAAPLECDVAGWLENAVCLYSGQFCLGERTNAVVQREKATALNCTAAAPTAPPAAAQPPIVFATFEGDDYGAWKAEGQAFGAAPAKGAPDKVQKLSGYQGKGLVNTWTSSDKLTGKLTSPPFKIERHFVCFLIGGGNHPGETCLNLLVDGKVVRSATANNRDAMDWCNWGVQDLLGKTARLEIVDSHSGGWGHIDIDQIEFRDTPRSALAGLPLVEQPDFGSLTLALLDPQPGDAGSAAINQDALPASAFDSAVADARQTQPFAGTTKPLGALQRRMNLAPGAQATVTFAVTWYFPQILHLQLPDIDGRQYGKRFDSSLAVVDYIAANFAELTRQTRLWHDTWYDSTLPHWFLERTFLNTSTLATSTAYWFGNKRFYGWEGVGCCAGTCQHVWHYAHAVARVFPHLERTTREMVDYGIGFDDKTGAMFFRGEFLKRPAMDGQAGTILRAYREHQMSACNAFLQRNWAKIKKSLEFLIHQDADRDGILDGSQHNTLDADWFGKVAWLSSLYVAALLAGEAMALEMGDQAFAQQARKLADAGQRNIVRELFNGEYFVQLPDQEHQRTVGSYNGCEIDQVFGQSWVFQVGLDRVLPREQTLRALRSLWRYNFTPDVGAFRAANKPGRWYAMAGEAGLIMCTWPRGDESRVQEHYDFYFNECMNGFEYQVAGHMIWEGMVQEGLAITRAVHDRYHAARRNPWNEVECGDHYARSMASYGVYLAACGYEHHGPKGHLAFAPKLMPEDFRAAFTAAEGWGVFHQARRDAQQTERIEMRWGKLCVTTLAFELTEKAALGPVAVRLDGQPIAAAVKADGANVLITLAQPVVVEAGKALEITLATA